MWYCCNCNHGPHDQAARRACEHCGVERCDFCPTEKVDGKNREGTIPVGDEDRSRTTEHDPTNAPHPKDVEKFKKPYEGQVEPSTNVE